MVVHSHHFVFEVLSEPKDIFPEKDVTPPPSKEEIFCRKQQSTVWFAFARQLNPYENPDPSRFLGDLRWVAQFGL